MCHTSFTPRLSAARARHRPPVFWMFELLVEPVMGNETERAFVIALPMGCLATIGCKGRPHETVSKLYETHAALCLTCGKLSKLDDRNWLEPKVEISRTLKERRERG